MTPRQLRYFIEIARANSFSRAAGILHVAQPALSRQIQQLEDDLSVKLFVRTDAGVLLTDAGTLLLERAPTLLEDYQRVREEVAAHATRPSGRLSIGVPPSLYGILTVSLVRECFRQFPELQISVTEGVSARMHEAVVGGQLDLAIVITQESGSNLTVRPLVQEQMLLLARPGSGVGPPVSIEDLAHLRLASTYRPNAMRMVLEDAMTKAGVRPNVVFESTSSRLLVEIASTGLAHAVLPYSAALEALDRGDLSANPVHGMAVGWMVVHGRNRLSRSIDAVAALICDLARSRVEAGQWPGAAWLDATGMDAMPK